MNINNVTLVAVSSIKIKETESKLLDCYNLMNQQFYDVVLVTHNSSNIDETIRLEYCNELKTINDYNEYVFRNLYQYINTSHCLLIQYDSGILRPELWDDSWLDYDYIGAPWPVKDDAYKTFYGETVRVGNGGFSLRSKKLMEIPSRLNMPLLEDRGYYNEDGNICVYYKNTFETLGIKYAPVDVAAKFSFETEVPENQGIDSFGYHRNVR